MPCSIFGIIFGILIAIIAHYQGFTPDPYTKLILWIYLILINSYDEISNTKMKQILFIVSTIVFGSGIFILSRAHGYQLPLHSFIGIWLIQIVITTLVSQDLWHLYLAQILSLIYLSAVDAINIYVLAFVNKPVIPLEYFFKPETAFFLNEVLWLSWFAVKSAVDEDEKDAFYEETENFEDGEYFTCETNNVNLSISFYFNIIITLLLFATRMNVCFGGTWTLILLTALGSIISFNSRYTWRDEIINTGVIMLGMFGLMLTFPYYWDKDYFSDVAGISRFVFWPACTAILISVLMFINILLDRSTLGIMFYILLASRYLYEFLLNYMPYVLTMLIISILLLTAGIFFERIREFILK